MAIRSLGFSRCCQAIIFLIASFPAFSAYTPPATPNLPLSFEFLGPNAEAESTAFYNTQCDSNNFSWYGIDWFCAVGDPSNPVCYVKMAYHSTDANQCNAYVPPEVPEIPQVPYGTDEFVNGSGTTKGLMEFLKARFDYDHKFNTELSSLTQRNLDENRTTNSLLHQMNSLLTTTYNNSNVVDAINSSGRILEIRLNDIRDNAADKNFWRVRHQLEDFNFSNQMGGITSQLTELGGLKYNVNEINNSLKGIASSDTQVISKLSSIANSVSYIEGLSNSIDYAALDIVAGAHSDSDKEQSLLTSLNESISSLEGSLNDSSKNIVDAIGDIPSGGTGSDPDAISETGCAAFSCSSNSPECYIARKAWERSCSATKNEADAQGLVDSLTASLKEYNDSEESNIQNIDAGKVDTSSLMNHYGEGNGFSSGGSSECPAPYVVDVVISTITIDLSPFCQLAAVIKWFVIAFATVGAGLMIAKYT